LSFPFSNGDLKSSKNCLSREKRLLAPCSISLAMQLTE
jgi:hypothetical protein